MSSDSDQPTGHRNNKKRRIARACDACRRRKIKCNGDEMDQCSYCCSLSIPCTYKLSPPRRGVAKDALDTLQKRAAKMEFFLKRILSDGDFDQEFGPNANLDKVKGEEENDFASNIPGTYRMATDALKRIHDDPPMDELGEDMSVLNIIDGSTVRFFGKSSGAVLLRSAVDAKKDVSGSPHSHVALPNQSPWEPYPWEHTRASLYPAPMYTFPPNDLMYTLIDLYFERYNSFIPLLHRPTFMKQVASGLHLTDEVFGANLLVVCASASRYSNDPRVFLEEHNSEHTCGWRWFGQIRLFKDSIFTTPRLFDLQFYSLAGIFLSGTVHVQACWAVIGLGIRLAQDVGADRRKRRPLTLADEQSKRAWWTLVIYDRLMAAHMGRQAAVKEEDFDQELPVDCDDEFWEHPDPARSFKQPSDMPSSSSSFIHLIGLIRLLGTIMRTLYPPNQAKYSLMGDKWQAKFATELDSALNMWIERLPAHLRWDPQRDNTTFLHQSALLYSNFYSLQIMIHRPYLPGPTGISADSLPSLAICTNAARSCIRVLEIHSRRSGTAYPLTQSITFLCGIVLILNMWNAKRAGPATALRDQDYLQTCFSLLRLSEPRWRTAGRFTACLNALASAGNLTPAAADIQAENNPRQFHDHSFSQSAASHTMPMVPSQSSDTGYSASARNPSLGNAADIFPPTNDFISDGFYGTPYNLDELMASSQPGPAAQGADFLAVWGMMPIYNVNRWDNQTSAVDNTVLNSGSASEMENLAHVQYYGEPLNFQAHI